MINRRNFLKATVVGLPLVGKQKAEVKDRPTHVHNLAQNELKTGHLLRQAMRFFDRVWIEPGAAAEFPLPTTNPYAKAIIYTDKKVPQRWEADQSYIIVPTYDVHKKHTDWREAMDLMFDQIESDCRHTIICAGEYNNKIIRGSREYICQEMSHRLKDGGQVFFNWSGPGPDFRKYIVGINPQEGEFVMPIRQEPTVMAYPPLTPVAFTEIGVTVLTAEHIWLGVES